MTQGTISAKDVAELRARTGAGMMDCKRALEEAGGDMARAVEILRARGIAKAEKRAGRTTSEGLVAGAVTEGGAAGALVELTCETDFVARTDDFSRAARTLLEQALAETPASLEEFLARPAAGEPGKTVAEVVQGLTARTGEAVALRRVVKFDAGPAGTVGLYLHHNRQVGVLVELESGSETAARSEAVQDLARELALHVASADPIAVRAEDIPAEVLERERRIATEQAAAEGKPEAVRAKIVEGKVRKFLAERTLLDQPWVKDDKQPVRTLVAAAAKAAGADLRVTRFARVRVGEA
jgi:elongation factor Ts